MTAADVPVLDIGGTHVTAALVSHDTVTEHVRVGLDADAGVTQVVDQIVDAASRLHAVRAGSTWGIAVPGPFDYRRGIGDFAGVAKFQSLKGFDLGAALTKSLPGPAGAVRFLNDAEAYALGEWRAFGSPDRMICITLGTGVGSGFVERGRPVNTGAAVPTDGDIHTEIWAERPLEETVSRAAIRRIHEARGGGVADVKEIAERARAGDRRAGAVLNESMMALGAVLARWVDRFEPDLIVVGGSISRSWDVLERGLLYGLSFAQRDAEVAVARRADDAPLVGAATFVTTPLESTPSI